MGLPRLRYPFGSANPITLDFKRGPIDFACEADARSHGSLAASGFRRVVKEAVDLLIRFTMPAVYIADDYQAWADFATWAGTGGEFDFWPNTGHDKMFHCVSDDLAFIPARKGVGRYEIQFVWRVVPDSLRPLNSGLVMQWYYGRGEIEFPIEAIGKVLYIGTGSAPVGWQNLGFDDSVWTAPVLQTLSFIGVPISGSQWVTDAAVAHPGVGGEQDLFRYSFTLPNAAVNSAAFSTFVDNGLVGVWLNGTQAYANSILDLGIVPITLEPSLLVTGGGTNLLALQIINGPGATNPMSLSFQLKLTLQGIGTGVLNS